MLDTLSDDYRALGVALHSTRKTYGAGGHWWARTALSEAERIGAASILDYGCGKGTFATSIKHMGWSGELFEYDPCVPGKEAQPSPADLVVCTDVLEHIEPEKIDNVLIHLRTLARKELMVTISTRPANKFLPDGRNAHLIIESPDWWFNKVNTFFGILRWEEDIRNPSEIFTILIDK